MIFESFESWFEKRCASLRADFGDAAEPVIAQIERDTEAQRQRDPLRVFANDRFYRAAIELKLSQTDIARRLQSNGIVEHAQTLDARIWHGRVLDLFIAELKPGEKLIEVHWWKLVTTLRTRTYHELKAACRMVVETNDAQFERSFESDETRRAAEAAEAERANPRAPQYGRNLDFPNGIRPGR
jgi:hypothetical protein